MVAFNDSLRKQKEMTRGNIIRQFNFVGRILFSVNKLLVILKDSRND